MIATRRRRPQSAKPIAAIEIMKIVLGAVAGLLLGWVAIELIRGNSLDGIAKQAEKAVAAVESRLR